MLGRCAGELVLARCSADGDGWRGGIIVLHLRVGGEVDRRRASVGDAGSRSAGAAIGDLVLPISCHIVPGGAIGREVGRLRGGGLQLDFKALRSPIKVEFTLFLVILHRHKQIFQSAPRLLTLAGSSKHSLSLWSLRRPFHFPLQWRHL